MRGSVPKHAYKNVEKKSIFGSENIQSRKWERLNNAVKMRTKKMEMQKHIKM